MKIDLPDGTLDTIALSDKRARNGNLYCWQTWTLLLVKRLLYNLEHWLLAILSAHSTKSGIAANGPIDLCYGILCRFSLRQQSTSHSRCVSMNTLVKFNWKVTYLGDCISKLFSYINSCFLLVLFFYCSWSQYDIGARERAAALAWRLANCIITRWGTCRKWNRKEITSTSFIGLSTDSLFMLSMLLNFLHFIYCSMK